MTIKHLAAILLLGCGAAVPGIAMERAQGYCELGGQAIVTSGLNSTTKAQKTYPGCTVSVYLTGTLTLATIYSNNSGSGKTNPFVADSTTGAWFWYAANGRYDVVMSGGGFASPVTVGDVLLADPVGSTQFVTSFNSRTGAVSPTSGDYTYSLIGGAKQGNTNVPQMAGANSATAGAVLCNDSAGNATTAACSFPSSVTSFQGRSGIVTAANGDYTAAQVTNAASKIAANVFSAANTFSAAVTVSGSIDSSNANTWSGPQEFDGTNTFTGHNIFTGNTVDSHNALHVFPVPALTTAAILASSCSRGEAMFATDAIAGQNLYYCTATNTWTQQLNSGGGGGGATTFNLIGTGANTTATMTLGSGSQLKTAGAASIDFAVAGHTRPNWTGVAGSLPATCAIGEVAFATDATAGQNLYFCTGVNTWTQQLNSGGGGGSAFSALSGGTNTGAAMVVGSGASMTMSGTGSILALGLLDGSQHNAIVTSTTASAVNYFTAKPSATGNAVQLSASGSDTNISMSLIPKGAGLLNLGSTNATVDTAGNLVVVGCTGCGGGGTSPPFADNAALVKNAGDPTKLGIFNIAAVTTGTTRTFTMQNASYTVAGLETAQTFTADQVFHGQSGFNNFANSAPSVDAQINSASSTIPAIAVTNNNSAGYGIRDYSAGGSFFGGPVFFGGSTVYAQNSGFVATNWAVTSSSGKVTEYGSYNTAGQGNPPIYLSTTPSNIVGISTNNFTMAGGNPPAGVYRVCAVAEMQAPGAAGNIQVSVFFNNGTGSKTLILISQPANTGNWNTSCGLVQTDGAHVVQYQFASGGTGLYHATIERVQ